MNADACANVCIVTGTDGTNGQRVKRMGTFNIIDFDDIPLDRRDEITYTKVVCEYSTENIKRFRIEHESQYEVTVSATQEMLALPRPPSN